MSFKEQREYDTLPARIEQLEAQISDLQIHMSQPEVFQDPTAIQTAQARLAELEAELEDAFVRWEALETKHQAWLKTKRQNTST
ncbi:MAG TPA: ATP-binding protein [Piscirickettsiaceae bacterium]|nr:ATP-binding protein [Piscirickettsiaceae bacterium]